MAAYERLDAWKLAHELTLRVYRETRGFPPEEKYGLVAQVRRSAASVPANIAEGSCTPSRAEFRRYLGIASRSLNETAYWLTLARDLEYLPPEEWKELQSLKDRTGKVLWSLIRSLAN